LPLGVNHVIPNFPGIGRKRVVAGEVKIGETQMKYAIVESGGKQYKAIPGATIEVDRLPDEVGDTIELDAVLVSDDGDVKVGTPYVDGIKVKASVVGEVKGPKIIVFKYKPKIRYRRKQGHRQRYTHLKIESIQEA
jgi:large subunit ribosomal protein L21